MIPVRDSLLTVMPLWMLTTLEGVAGASLVALCVFQLVFDQRTKIGMPFWTVGRSLVVMRATGGMFLVSDSFHAQEAHVIALTLGLTSLCSQIYAMALQRSWKDWKIGMFRVGI